MEIRIGVRGWGRGVKLALYIDIIGRGRCDKAPPPSPLMEGNPAHAYRNMCGRSISNCALYSCMNWFIDWLIFRLPDWTQRIDPWIKHPKVTQGLRECHCSGRSLNYFWPWTCSVPFPPFCYVLFISWRHRLASVVQIPWVPLSSFSGQREGGGDTQETRKRRWVKLINWTQLGALCILFFARPSRKYNN